MKLRNYALVTAGYWAFTLTDGALRMLVLLHFHDLGYSPVEIAFLFLLYELMGIVTNLDRWLGRGPGRAQPDPGGRASVSRSSPWGPWRPSGRRGPSGRSVAFVMGMQALSGVAKDLTKMSSKSAVKFVAGEGACSAWWRS